MSQITTHFQEALVKISHKLIVIVPRMYVYLHVSCGIV